MKEIDQAKPDTSFTYYFLRNGSEVKILAEVSDRSLNRKQKAFVDGLHKNGQEVFEMKCEERIVEVGKTQREAQNRLEKPMLIPCGPGERFRQRHKKLRAKKRAVGKAREMCGQRHKKKTTASKMRGKSRRKTRRIRKKTC